MDRPTVVRGLWGNSILKRGHCPAPQAYARVLEQVTKLSERSDITDVVYCFGDDNLEYLRYHGFSNVIQLSRFAWASPRLLDETHHRWEGHWLYGHSIYWHKLKILQTAVANYGPVLYLDMDVHQLREVPSSFWVETTKGQPLRTPLSWKRQWRWGAPWRHSGRWKKPELMIEGDSARAAQMNTTTGFLYVRNIETANLLMENQQEEPSLLDDQIVCLTVDRLNGGWIGEDAYLSQGYHLDGLKCNRLLHPSQDPIWVTKL